MSEHYDKDAYFRPLVSWIRKERKGVTDETLKKEFGSLVQSRRKRFELDEETGLLFIVEQKKRLCIPRGGGLRHKLFHEAHDTEIAGHFGANRTYNLLNEQFLWP